MKGYTLEGKALTRPVYRIMAVTIFKIIVKRFQKICYVKPDTHLLFVKSSA